MEIDYKINIGNFEVYKVIYGEEFKMKILIYDGDYMSKDIVLLFVNSLLLLLDGYI